MYLTIDPPDPRYELRLGESVTILPSYGDTSQLARRDLPAGAVVDELFVPEWNAFVRFAAMDTTFSWLETA